MPYKYNPFTDNLDYYEASTGTPGPPGPTGATGPAGNNGINGLDGEDGLDGMSIIGPPGPAGANGTIGRDGSIGMPGMDGSDGDEGVSIPGQQGPQGIQGPAGVTTTTTSFIYLDADSPDEAPMVPGPVGPQGPAGSGGGGSVTIKTTTITVPYGSQSYVATVVDASVLAASNLIVFHGSYSDTDTNDPDMDNLSFHVETIAAGSFQLEVSAIGNTTIGGPFKFTYLIG